MQSEIFFKKSGNEINLHCGYRRLDGPISRMKGKTDNTCTTTHLIKTILVHQRLLLYPVDVERTELEEEIIVANLGWLRGHRPRRGGGGDRRTSSDCLGHLAIVVGVAARGSLWGWNKRHTLVENQYRWFSQAAALNLTNNTTAEMRLFVDRGRAKSTKRIRGGR